MEAGVGWGGGVRKHMEVLSFHVSFAILVKFNRYKAQSNCIHDPTFRHSRLALFSAEENGNGLLRIFFQFL